VSLAGDQDVDDAKAAAAAFPEWRRTPPQNRIQFLFKFRALLEQHGDEIARTTSPENGKTFAESRAELQRGIENVEVACGIPSMMQSYNLDDVASGLDEIMIRQPLGAMKRRRVISGINIGVAAPMAYFPFSGWKDSFLGILHGQGSDGVEFYSEKKVVVERWPNPFSVFALVLQKPP
jgi:malonate-semialdehyde dehydrogenase (acetylating) / methylmalonate-semialdehyde dehydrogenase